MKRYLYPLTVLLLFLSIDAHAQTDGKVEIQAQFTSLNLATPYPYASGKNEPGFGGRVVYNFNDNFAVEGEGNFFPSKYAFNVSLDGRAVQGQFGVKVGKRFRKFGIFAKARPGFLSIDKTFFYDGTIREQPPDFPPSPGYQIARKTHFTMDVGAVLEFYPTKKTVVRFDAGETFVRFGSSLEVDYGSSDLRFFTLPATTTHRFQFSSAVGFRLGKAKDSAPAVNTGSGKDSLPKFEVGIQFATLIVQPPTVVCWTCSTLDYGEPVNDPGVGGRFTYNLTPNIALEAEGNFFARDLEPFGVPGGHIYQGQFGGKFGKRFTHFGVFGKVRPGFVGFSQVYQLTATHHGIFVDGRPFEFGEFRFRRQTYFSTDVGGVLEFYVSRHVMTRMDFGDTIIRYGERQTRGFGQFLQIIRRPPESRHNFQINAGVGFRF